MTAQAPNPSCSAKHSDVVNNNKEENFTKTEFASVNKKTRNWCTQLKCRKWIWKYLKGLMVMG